MMEVIQCPRCRTISYPGLMGYPRCHRCHEPLRQCLHCRHQQGGLCSLPAAERPPLLDDEGLPYCTAFASRYARGAGEPWWRRPLPATQRIMVLGGMVAVMAIAAGMLFARPEPFARGLAVDAEQIACLNGAARLGVWVYADPATVAEVVLEVDRTEGGAYWMVAEPAPLDRPGTNAYRLGYAIPSSGRMRLELEFRTREPRPPREQVELRLTTAAGEPLDAAKVIIGPPTGAS